MTVAYVTEMSNIAHPTDEISDGISAALVKKVVAVPFVKAEDLPVQTAIKLFRKGGSLTAETVAESTAYTPSASSELTETTVSATAAKSAVVTYWSVENSTFGVKKEEDIPAEHGRAIGRALDDEILALLDGFTDNTVTCDSVLTAEDMLAAAFEVNNDEADRVEENLVAFLSARGVFNLQKQLVQTGATAFGNSEMLSILMNTQSSRGYRGSLPGIDVYQVSGVPTSGSDDVGLVFNPDLAFGGMYGKEVDTWISRKGVEGFYTEYASYLFHKVVEWNDKAGCAISYDT